MCIDICTSSDGKNLLQESGGGGQTSAGTGWDDNDCYGNGWGRWLSLCSSLTHDCSYLHAYELILGALLRRSQVKPRQSEWGTDFVACMGAEKEGHSTCAEVTISIYVTSSGMNLWVSPEVTNTLYVDDYQPMTRTLKCEVAKCL